MFSCILMNTPLFFNGKLGLLNCLEHWPSVPMTVDSDPDPVNILFKMDLWLPS